MDWNEDGLEDLIVGHRYGSVCYFRRLPGGELTSEPDLSTPNGTIEVGTNSAPEITDWNNDGLLDLVVGCAETYPGSIHLFLNSGEPGAPCLDDSSLLKANGEFISIVYSCPRVYDLDQDGLRDLLVGGCSGHVYWFRNVGTAQEPELEEGVQLQSNGEPLRNDAEVRIWPCDYDCDGIPDLLTSDYDGVIYFFPGLPTGVSSEHARSGDGDLLTITENPCRGVLRLRIHRPVPVRVSLYSMDGHRVSGPTAFEAVDRGESASLDVSDLPGGAYLLRAESPRCVQHGKLILIPGS
ncbi:hypothetical protein GF402_09815 [Candidatus Fermentibacteria bacterium]|nr:hypothetical protein [Candidatus Fermentibacteria bacterium]